MLNLWYLLHDIRTYTLEIFVPVCNYVGSGERRLGLIYGPTHDLQTVPNVPGILRSRVY